MPPVCPTGPTKSLACACPVVVDLALCGNWNGFPARAFHLARAMASLVCPTQIDELIKHWTQSANQRLISLFVSGIHGQSNAAHASSGILERRPRLTHLADGRSTRVLVLPVITPRS